MRLISSILLLPIFLRPVLAIDWDDHCDNKFFCLTSFVWCERSNDNGNCEYPEDVYPIRRSSNVGRAALLWYTEYELTWRGTDSDYPVLVEWQVRMDETEEGDLEDSHWERNFTKGETSFSFKFASLAQEIVDNNSNISIMAIKGRASGYLANGLQVSQPGREYDGVEDGDAVFDYSDYFSVYDYSAGHVIEEQRKAGQEEVFNTWKLGVGVGVGVGVPIFLAASCVGGFFFGKRRGRRAVGASAKDGH